MSWWASLSWQTVGIIACVVFALSCLIAVIVGHFIAGEPLLPKPHARCVHRNWQEWHR